MVQSHRALGFRPPSDGARLLSPGRKGSPSDERPMKRQKMSHADFHWRYGHGQEQPPTVESLAKDHQALAGAPRRIVGEGSFHGPEETSSMGSPQTSSSSRHRASALTRMIDS